MKLISLSDMGYKEVLIREFTLPDPIQVGRLFIWKNVSPITNYYSLYCNNGKSIHLVKHMDQFIIAIPNHQEEREILFEEFFDWIAINYLSMIDDKRNLENINILLNLLRRHNICEQGQLILDFGCGPGLSRNSQGCGKAKIIGFDPSPTMRMLAKQKGMIVWDYDDMERQAPGTIDGIFASYVLHNAACSDSLQLAVSLLNKNGIFAANFHKGAERQWADNLFFLLGMQSVFEVNDHIMTHGPQVLYGKKSEQNENN